MNFIVVDQDKVINWVIFFSYIFFDLLKFYMMGMDMYVIVCVQC